VFDELIPDTETISINISKKVTSLIFDGIILFTVLYSVASNISGFIYRGL
jgi:hypothetical protein